MPTLEDGKYYSGTFERFDVIEVGQNAKKAAQVTFRHEDGAELKTIIGWFGSVRSDKDGKTGTYRIMETLINFGCDAVRLRGAAWLDHINLTMAGQEVQAKAEEYNGRVSLKNLYQPRTLAQIVNPTESPFSDIGETSSGDGGGLPF